MLLDDSPTHFWGTCSAWCPHISQTLWLYHDYLIIDRLHHCFGSTEYVHSRLFPPRESLHKFQGINHQAEFVAGMRQV